MGQVLGRNSYLYGRSEGNWPLLQHSATSLAAAAIQCLYSHFLDWLDYGRILEVGRNPTPYFYQDRGPPQCEPFVPIGMGKIIWLDYGMLLLVNPRAFCSSKSKSNCNVKSSHDGCIHFSTHLVCLMACLPRRLFYLDSIVNITHSIF
jgi:hypothetical protein